MSIVDNLNTVTFKNRSRSAIRIASKLLGLVLILTLAGCGNGEPTQPAGNLQPALASVEHGRYLVQIASCNDCHTPGYLMNDGNIPEAQWLVGDTFGWRGPWGTTYATNLRTRMQAFTEDQWVAYARALKARPPMPWFALNEMHESDLRSIYRYVRSLGADGMEAPPYLPPEQEPPPPYALFP